MFRIRLTMFVVLSLFVLLFTAPVFAATCTSWNLTTDWNSTYLNLKNRANPVKDACGAGVWYFQRFVPGIGYQKLEAYRNDFSSLGIQNYGSWEPSSSQVPPAEYCDLAYMGCVPSVAKNYNSVPLFIPGPDFTVPAEAIVLHPSLSHRAVVAWKNPYRTKIFVSAVAEFTDIDINGGVSASFYVHKGASQLASGVIPPTGAICSWSTLRLEVAGGETIYFSVDPGESGLQFDSTQLSVRINKVP